MQTLKPSSPTPLSYATDDTDPDARGHLLRNLMLFGRVLRALGLDINPGRMIDLAHALALIDLRLKVDFQSAARALLVHDKDDIPLFDQAFEMFWRKPVDKWTSVDLPSLRTIRRRTKPQIVAPPLTEPPPDENEGDAPTDPTQPPLLEVVQTYSDREVLRRKDFSEMTADEMGSVKQLMTGFVWNLGERRTRRHKSGKDQMIDMRRTLRRNLKHGGEILQFARKTPKYKPRPLIIIADISGSMERYSRLLMQFVYSVSSALDQPVESFVFSTQLTHITRELDNKDIDTALKEVAHTVVDWSGGTRIGDSLKTFNFQWGRRVLGRGAVVLLISDGWDRGDPDLLSVEMKRLHLNCHRLIWLNPLLGASDYEPLTRGMQAALPQVDDFLPVHNLASLEALAKLLEQLK